ncbi:MAG: hypothetical protein OEQ39_18360 [Gammaproteobacteria bacterium]|nr:hypothetical protein [Gammaproteobacteria bacterium]MDH3465660.1 hypothetical protein [Gammaproteobacteria bacterium]
MTNDDIVIIGLPSAGLQKLTGAFYIHQVENVEIRHVCDNPNGPRDFTPEWMTGKLEGYFDDDSGHRTLMTYQTPWGFLERQIRRVASTPATPEQLESFAKSTLGFWYTYHASLLGLYREHEGRCLLINGDRPVGAEAVAALVEERFGLRLRVQQNPPVEKARDAPSHREAAWCQIVEVFTPECVDLYGELESCAELMGHQPEFDSGEFASRDAYMRSMLWLMVIQGRIDDILSRYGVDSGDRESGLETVLQAHRVQLRHMEDKLATENSEIDSLKKENELYLLQLHQIQEELEHYFELNRQKEEQLAELQRRLGPESAPVVRKIARRMVDLKKSAARLIPSFSAQAGGARGQDKSNKRALKVQAEKIRASGLFDDAWYLQTYADVAQAGHDPIEHYLIFGVADGRNPSARFNTKWYLEAYSDVAAAGMNPLLHYIEFGKAEGRQPMRFVA